MMADDLEGVPELIRPAVRILCLDPSERVLLLNWRDPVDGRSFWEPPGGGVEDGESDLQAAHRELLEETGLVPDSLVGPVALVQRDSLWAGRRLMAVEPFFLARVGDNPVGPLALTDEERMTLLGHRWFGAQELRKLTATIEPSDLLTLLAEHVGGQWGDPA